MEDTAPCSIWKDSQYQERFRWQRLDGLGLDTATKEFLAIEFKRAQDARSNPQSSSISSSESGSQKKSAETLPAALNVTPSERSRAFCVAPPAHVRHSLHAGLVCVCVCVLCVCVCVCVCVWPCMPACMWNAFLNPNTNPPAEPPTHLYA